MIEGREACFSPIAADRLSGGAIYASHETSLAVPIIATSLEPADRNPEEQLSARQIVRFTACKSARTLLALEPQGPSPGPACGNPQACRRGAGPFAKSSGRRRPRTAPQRLRQKPFRRPPTDRHRQLAPSLANA